MRPVKSGGKKLIDSRRPDRIGGFTYLAVLAIMAIMGIILAATAEIWRIAQKREKEQFQPRVREF